MLWKRQLNEIDSQQLNGSQCRIVTAIEFPTEIGTSCAFIQRYEGSWHVNRTIILSNAFAHHGESSGYRVDHARKTP